MGGIKLKKLLQTKEPGEEWYALLPPHTCFVWTPANPWDDDFIEHRGVKPHAITVAERVDESKEKVTLSKKVPKALECGVDIVRGSIISGQFKKYIFTVPVDSTRQFNQAMKELSMEYKVKSWDITRVVIFGKNGAVVTFKMHNPDGNGTGLFLWEAEMDKDSKLYPEIAIGTQMLLVANFRETETDDKMAKCICDERTMKFHGCQLTYKATKEAMKKKMNGKWLHLN